MLAQLFDLVEQTLRISEREQGSRLVETAPTYLALLRRLDAPDEAHEKVGHLDQEPPPLKRRHADLLNGFSCDAGLLSQLPTGGLGKRLPPFDVSLGEDPVERVLLRTHDEH